MRHINYNHLFYFWNVADTGSIAAASKRLYLTPQTISTQIKLLEETTGATLFRKSGRKLVLTEQGMMVKGFADQIFSLGTELSAYMRGGEIQRISDLTVGIVETLPKIAVENFLEPAFDAGVRLCCKEGGLKELIAELNQHQLDLILSDRAASISDGSAIYVHLLGISKLAIYSPESLWQELRNNLPMSLDTAPIILPAENSPLRRAGDDWFLQHGMTPNIVAECSDSALIKAMASAGRGVFIAPLNIKEEIESATACRMLLELNGFEERYYAITLEKTIKHPVVEAIADIAKTSLAVGRSLN